MDNKDAEVFVELSSLLCGFDRDVIAPPSDPEYLANTYFELVRRRTGGPFLALLARFAAHAGGTRVRDMSPDIKYDTGVALLQPGASSSDPRESATARAIMKLWYLGSWYQPFDHNEFSQGEVFVVSSVAYIRGLVWKAMQSHAMGYSEWPYGHWSFPPPPLPVFAGNNIQTQTQAQAQAQDLQTQDQGDEA